MCISRDPRFFFFFSRNFLLLEDIFGETGAQNGFWETSIGHSDHIIGKVFENRNTTKAREGSSSYRDSFKKLKKTNVLELGYSLPSLAWSHEVGFRAWPPASAGAGSSSTCRCWSRCRRLKHWQVPEPPAPAKCWRLQHLQVLEPPAPAGAGGSSTKATVKRQTSKPKKAPIRIQDGCNTVRIQYGTRI